ncbi:metal-dependent transcriptional regulator [Brucepastera parasyntrophica]|uniref:metal-dependent transcriptional regulator n=1 Tax=Brucepastera parasyntrophica TaxID=2880008 RepID=UPI00210F178F|nr:metal-dependent transcriptional regulator [Brucepastera parasyntrophica]ULQ59445.1 metal-dependent transcriptional regulator [Brucepastera parasyntrophica]
MRIEHSKEDYLEAILVLSEKQQEVRSIDVADFFGYSKPSISRAISLLRDDGFIELDEHKHISLTREGRKIADKVYEKHTFFRDMLEQAGVDEKTAAADACRLEHAISNKSFDKLKAAYLKNHSP